ncbi:hypothetical protein [Novipirellula sp.]|uniref:hypothetical protein n=1 Tax=Novipirellula sp. TaxID=2795430 RepID=UPI00356B3418
MLMRIPEYPIQDKVENKCGLDEPFVDHQSPEMLVGQIALILLFVIAILLRAIA